MALNLPSFVSGNKLGDIKIGIILVPFFSAWAKSSGNSCLFLHWYH